MQLGEQECETGTEWLELIHKREQAVLAQAVQQKHILIEYFSSLGVCDKESDESDCADPFYEKFRQLHTLIPKFDEKLFQSIQEKYIELYDDWVTTAGKVRPLLEGVLSLGTRVERYTKFEEIFAAEEYDGDWVALDTFYDGFMDLRTFTIAFKKTTGIPQDTTSFFEKHDKENSLKSVPFMRSLTYIALLTAAMRPLGDSENRAALVRTARKSVVKLRVPTMIGDAAELLPETTNERQYMRYVEEILSQATA